MEPSVHHLPTELLYTIFLNLNINELKILYKISPFIQTLLNSRDLLNLLNHQYDIVATSFNQFITLYKKKTLSLLNKLGKIYHSTDGFYWNNEYYENYTLAVESFKDNVTVFTEDGDLISSIDELKPGETYGTLPNEFPEQLEALSNMIMPYRTIIIIQEVEWRKASPEVKYKNVPNYIQINIPFEKITLSADLKGVNDPFSTGQDLTIKDVLIASQLMAVDPYDTVIENEYIILEDNEILVIKIDVNYRY